MATGRGSAALARVKLRHFPLASENLTNNQGQLGNGARGKLVFSYWGIFIPLHAMQTRSSGDNSVCPSVRPSVCQTRAL